MRLAPTFVPLAAATLALLAATPASAGSGGSDGDRALRIEIHDHDHANLSLTVDASFVSGIVHTFSPSWMDCTTDRDDREMVELVRYLDEHGEGARGMVTHHGDRVHGRRHANRLELQVDERDGDRAEITLPWGSPIASSVATSRCARCGTTPSATATSRSGSSARTAAPSTSPWTRQSARTASRPRARPGCRCRASRG